MMKNKRENWVLPTIIIVVVLVLFFSCNLNIKALRVKTDGQGLNDFDRIMKRGKLVAITDYNSTNYFVYRGEPMGYQFEMLQKLADYLNIKLEIIVSNDLNKAFNYLRKGKCDLIAENLTITKERSKVLAFTRAHSQTRQVLVQRKPESWEELTQMEINLSVIRNQLDLADKTIYVQENSAYSHRLRHLADEIGDSIQIIEVPDEVEKLISLVVKGDIDYTVCDENVALVNQTYYPELDVQTAISFPQNLAWAVSKDSPALLEKINAWQEQFMQTSEFSNIYNKYFNNGRSAKIVNSSFYALTTGRVSIYDDQIKKYSQQINWDWRLLASLIYQESRFDPNSKSWAGAFGLMQLMPQTAKLYGVSILSNPEENIRAGVRLIKWLEQRIEERNITDEEEKLKFVLAAYNAGLGHVLDAMRLAEKSGKNPNKWDGNVDFYVLNKSNPDYYLDPVVKFGYCRGEEPYNYVNEIIDRYKHYKNILKVD